MFFAKTINNMGKITEIKLVGQPIFKQVIDLIERINIPELVRKNNSDYYYKAFKAKTQLITMLFGILSRCDSMNEICEGLRAMGGKLNHLGLKKAPAKSTACDGLRNSRIQTGGAGKTDGLILHAVGAGQLHFGSGN